MLRTKKNIIKNKKNSYKEVVTVDWKETFKIMKVGEERTYTNKDISVPLARTITSRLKKSDKMSFSINSDSLCENFVIRRIL
uniref:hypothetical protein n=1 Tax=uncultured Bacteroides sp. TaxID=162156 RepID=UPI0026010ACB|nr:hypothetical protein [uncultured Bacteroides sp.]